MASTTSGTMTLKAANRNGKVVAAAAWDWDSGKP